MLLHARFSTRPSLPQQHANSKVAGGIIRVSENRKGEERKKRSQRWMKRRRPGRRNFEPVSSFLSNIHHLQRGARKLFPITCHSLPLSMHACTNLAGEEALCAFVCFSSFRLRRALALSFCSLLFFSFCSIKRSSLFSLYPTVKPARGRNTCGRGFSFFRSS